MYSIFFFRDKSGKEPVLEYLKELELKSDKNSRIKLNKIQDYIQLLSKLGLSIGEPFVKHVEGDIWELRPIRDRIFFVCCSKDSFILLHHFMKKTQKTPRREIEKAKRELTEIREQENE